MKSGSVVVEVDGGVTVRVGVDVEGVVEVEVVVSVDVQCAVRWDKAKTVPRPWQKPES